MIDGLDAPVHGHEGLRRGHEEITGVYPEPSTKAPTLDTVIEAVQKTYPGIWKRCYTKHIEVPGNYRNMKAVAATFASVEIETRFYLLQKRLVSNGYIISQELEKFDWPCYFVHKPLLDALRHTHPPQQQTWEDIKFPFPALTFMLPRGSLYDITGAEVYALGVANFGKTIESAKIPDWMKAQGGHGYERVAVYWLFEPAGCMLHDVTFPRTQALEPDPEWINKATADQVKQGYRPDQTATGEFASQMAAIAANLLLVMQARPELVESGGKTGRLLPKTKTPIHQPTFIGRKYVVRQEGPRPDARGHFTELRWVAGHMRNQAFGKGNSERKLIFIEPFVKYGAGLVRE